MTSGTMDPELFRIKWNLFVCFFFALELLLGKRRKVSRNSRTTYETTLLSANLPSTTILAKDQVLQNHTKDTLRNTMVASVSQEGAKCEMIVTPFAGQLEGTFSLLWAQKTAAALSNKALEPTLTTPPPSTDY